MFIKFEKKGVRQHRMLVSIDSDHGIIRLNSVTRDVITGKNYIGLYFDDQNEAILLKPIIDKEKNTIKIVRNVCAGNQVSLSCKSFFTHFNITKSGVFSARVYTGTQLELLGSILIDLN